MAACMSGMKKARATAQLLQAVMTDSDEAVHKAMADPDCDPNLKLIAGDTVVHISIRMKAHLALYALLDYDVNLTICNDKGNTALHEASMIGSLDGVQLLLTRGGKPGAADPNQMRNLKLANPVMGPIMSTLSFLVKITPLWRAGPDYTPLRTAGWTALHCAAYTNYTHVGELLLGVGADPNAQNEYKRTPLHLAVYRDHLEMAWLLLARGADPNIRDFRGDTPLHDAARGPHLEMAELLLFFGATNDVTNGHGKRPGQVAADASTKTLVQLPLHISVLTDQLDLLADLLNPVVAKHRPKVEPDGRGIMGETALHVAAAHGNVGAATLLIDAGAHIDATDGDQNTPLHYAAAYAQPEMADYLLSRGAKKFVYNLDGKMPRELVPVHRSREPPAAKRFKHAKAKALEREQAAAAAAEAAAELLRPEAKGRSSTARKSAAAAEAVAAAAAERLEKTAREAREYDIAVVSKLHLMQLRPWGTVVPPTRIRNEAMELAIQDVDGPGGAAGAIAAHKQKMRLRVLEEEERMRAESAKREDTGVEEGMFDEVGEASSKAPFMPSTPHAPLAVD